jgi:hypothetical protein
MIIRRTKRMIILTMYVVISCCAKYHVYGQLRIGITTNYQTSLYSYLGQQFGGDYTPYNSGKITGFGLFATRKMSEKVERVNGCFSSELGFYKRNQSGSMISLSNYSGLNYKFGNKFYIEPSFMVGVMSILKYDDYFYMQSIVLNPFLLVHSNVLSVRGIVNFGYSINQKLAIGIGVIAEKDLTPRYSFYSYRRGPEMEMVILKRLFFPLLINYTIK